MYDAHTRDIHDEFTVYKFCDQTFGNNRDLIEHKKETHGYSIYQGTC